MDKFQTHSRIMLEADVREATLRYMEKNGTETFSEALNELARSGARTTLEKQPGVKYMVWDREMLRIRDFESEAEALEYVVNIAFSLMHNISAYADGGLVLLRVIGKSKLFIQEKRKGMDRGFIKMVPLDGNEGLWVLPQEDGEEDA